MMPCRAFCDRAAGECAPAGDECLSACTAQQNGFEDAICGIYYTQLLSCWGQDLSCDNGKPAVGSCGPAVAEVADCVARRKEACDGFCWAADIMGCGADDCVTTCKAKTDETTCGHYYRSVIDCTYSSRELALSCEADGPTPDAVKCASQIMQYDSCVKGQ